VFKTKNVVGVLLFLTGLTKNPDVLLFRPIPEAFITIELEYVDIVSVRYPTASIAIGRQAYYKYFQKRSWQMKNYHILKKRRTQFLSIAKKHGIDILNTTDLVPFMYTNKSVEWWMKHFNVETRKGSDFNDTDKHSRFNLMISDDHWKEFIKRN
jgi:hypothetical protein